MPIIHLMLALGDAVIQRDGGPADISLEDYAVAMMDEAESAKHRRQRFTVAN